MRTTITTVLMTVLVMFSFANAKVVVSPMPIDSVEVTILPDTTNKVSVPATVEVYDSLYVDSVNSYNVDDLVDYLQSVDSTFDGSEAAVNARIAARLKVIEAAKAQADSLARAQIEQKWAVVDSIAKTLPRDPGVAIDSVDFQDSLQSYAYYSLFGANRGEIEYAAKQFGDAELVMLNMVYALVDQEIGRRAVELNGPAHKQLKTAIADNTAAIATNATAIADNTAAIATNAEAVNVTYQISMTNAKDIRSVSARLEQVESNVFVALRLAKLAKLRGSQGSDNAELQEQFENQAKTDVKPVNLLPIQITLPESNNN